MKFTELLRRAELSEEKGRALAPEIGHICCDSRLTRADSVFVCINGAVTDGHHYARNAYVNGCRAFVAERKIELPADAAIAYTDNSRKTLALLSHILYGKPSSRLKVIGITGTKGKTTTAYMIKAILESCGVPTGYIGSNGVEYGAFHHMTINTTPESCDLQRYFAEMYTAGMRYVALEVSSQALYLERAAFIEFDTCVFTNLSPDHIGEAEHPDFEHYKECKASLFSKFPLRRAVANADDLHTPDMISRCIAPIDTFGFSPAAHHRAENIKLLRTPGMLGTEFDYVADDRRIRTTLSLPGDINVSNALAAIAVCSDIIGDKHRVVMALRSIVVKGRFELVNALPNASVVIDYAHNGISLRSVLMTLRAYNPKRLITLFGSVGGRTQMRRAELGSIASELSDFCILTADNPDSEHPMLIIRDIAAAFVPGGCEYRAIPDRREAIQYAVGMLRDGDILLLAGKGHENYQLIRGVKEEFSEREIVIKAAEAAVKTPF